MSSIQMRTHFEKAFAGRLASASAFLSPVGSRLRREEKLGPVLGGAGARAPL